MARIRTVKPEFFRDEDLQDLEQRHPDAKPMLVFAGLWGHCDKQGVFEWKPRVLKLDILPFLPFDMETTLDLLASANLVEKFEVDGKFYGLIDSFQTHQRIGGKEFSDPAKHPGKPKKHRGSNGEATEQHSGLQEGKGREREGKGTDRAREAKTSPTLPENDQSPQRDAVESRGGKHRDPDAAYAVIQRIQSTYPKGTYTGSTWIQAERQVSKLLDAGELADELVRLASEYAAQQIAKGSVGTQYVRSPENFFDDDGYWRGPFPLPKSPTEAQGDANRAELLRRISGGSRQ